jgi:histone H3/H4
MARAKPRKRARSQPLEMLLVASKVRQRIKGAGFHTAGDALDGLNAAVAWLLDQASRRARRNGRKTVRGHDFIIT